MRINNNISAINAHRFMKNSNTILGKSTEKLSSGQRINRASDDAAGLAISEKMRSQIRGLDQNSRNIQDGISLIQTAEGGLNEIHNLLQRGRELSVQASNGTLTESDRTSIQEEVEQIRSEIDRVANNTEFNTINLLNKSSTSASDQEAVIEWLQKSWLENAETLIQNQYGITGDGADLKIVLDEGSPGGALAYVQYTVGGDGKGNNMELHIDMSDFVPVVGPHGGTAPLYNDRIITHEMVHAVMGRSMNFASLPKWFKEGTAELIHGADERVNGDIAFNGGGAAGINAVVAAIGDGTDGTWVNDSTHYSAGYSATRYMHDQIKGSGGNGVKDILTYLQANPLQDLDQALANASSGAFTGLNDFVTKFSAAGAAFIGGFNLGNTDTGAIGGLDVDGGGIKTAETVADDTINPVTTDPLSNFNEIWPTVNSNTEALKLQIGPNLGTTISLNLTDATSSSLALSNLDLVNSASDAIETFDNAINTVSYNRSRLGAVQNRLEHAFKVTNISKENVTASESRIRDVDMAKEMMTHSKNNILQQAAQSMLSQSNQRPQAVLQLLK